MSIVIPTYQRAHTLGRAIDGALAQTYRPLEVVVADNASTDGTPELLDGYRDDDRVRVLRHARNLGPVANWEAALDAARGGLIKINWSDDWMDRHVVESLAAELVRDPSAGFAICGHTIHSAGAAQRWDAPWGTVRLSHLVRSVCVGTYALPVSPGAALLYRDDAIWGLQAARQRLSASCIERAIGPDLLMLYGSLRRASHGVAIRRGGVHFEAGSDSITMGEDFDRLRRCYLEALEVLLVDSGAAVERALLRQLESLRRVMDRVRGRAEVPSVPRGRTPLSAHIGAAPSTAAGLFDYLRLRVGAR